MGLLHHSNTHTYLKNNETLSKNVISDLHELLEKPRSEENTDWNSSGFVVLPVPKTDVKDSKSNQPQTQLVQKVQGIGLYAPNVIDEVFRNDRVKAAVHAISGKKNLDFFGTKFFPMYPGGNI